MSELKLYEEFVQSLLEEEKILVRNRKSGAVYDINQKSFDPRKHEVPKPKEDVKEKEKNAQANGYTGPKDKGLDQSIKTTETKEFNRSLEPSAAEFEKRNKKSANPTPPQPFKFPQDIFKETKFPKKYVESLERMMNSRASGAATKWSHFSDIPGGAGKISSQAGELMTMMGVSMSDEDFDKFTKAMLDHQKSLIENHPELKASSARIIDKSWIESARKNRKAILKKLQEDYPGCEVAATCWDTEDDVSSLGMKDYKKNKGETTDMYIKVKTKDGKYVLDENSLKKDHKKINLSNSGAGKFAEWDPNVPDSINQSKYAENQKKSLIEVGDKLASEIEKLPKNSKAAEALKKAEKEKGITFAEALKNLKEGKGKRRDNMKIVLAGVRALAEKGDPAAKKHLEDVQRQEKEFQKEAIKAITENPKLKEGLLKDIKEEFPLKAVADGEESIILGEYPLSKRTMKKIFGTDNYEDIKDNLVAEKGPDGESYLGYRADVKDKDGKPKIIRIATISIREDGVGYGGIMKFDMVMNPDFSKRLEEANK